MPNYQCSIRNVKLSAPRNPFPSPAENWQNEVIYFLLPDRFSDGREQHRPLLQRSNKRQARGNSSWKDWSNSGEGRWQGGTLAGVSSKLSYLQHLGVTALWIGPVFRQRRELNTFHGYSIQNYLEVDPRLGTTQDLTDLVQEAHKRGIRIILDIVFNHSGNNWVYAGGNNLPNYAPYPSQYDLGFWRGSSGLASVATPQGEDEGVWPSELQSSAAYMRAGLGSLNSRGDENPDDGTLEFRRSDFPPDGLRKFNHYATDILTDLVLCYKYWISVTDCDGFRIDTVKHIAAPIVRNFTGAIKEYADSIGKSDFFLVAEIGGGDSFEEDYLDEIDLHKLNAALDIGSAKQSLRNVARGLASPSEYFQRFSTTLDVGQSRKIGSRLVSVVDDHDNLSCERLRFSFSAPAENQIVAALAIQLFSLSIPCIYYGSEQALGFDGPGSDPGYETQYLLGQGWGSSDCFLREALFGPEHPRQDASVGSAIDPAVPGFGPFGTSGFHCFDEFEPTFVRSAHLIDVRSRHVPLRTGRQYQRPLEKFGWNNLNYPGGDLIAWSRILDDWEILIVVNGHGLESRGGNVLVDYNLNPPGSVMTVIGNTAERAAISSGQPYTGPHPIGSKIPVSRLNDGPAFLQIGNIAPSEVLVISNR